MPVDVIERASAAVTLSRTVPCPDRRWRPLLLALLPLAIATAGCGDDPPAASRKPVRLTITAPQDGAITREATVLISGDVAPATSHVLVAGERASVTEGRFSATVGLREGANVIDVGASAPGARATWRALRVTRHSKIALPDVVGTQATAATTALEALGLKVSVSIDDSLLDLLRSRPRIVCEMDPASGSQIAPGSEVQLVVSRTC